MGNKKTFKSILMAGTIFAGGMLGAGETPQQDNRNFFEKGVHTTTSVIDEGVHAVTETVLYPVRGIGWLLSEGGRQIHNGLNFIGNHTGVVGRMITTPVGKGAHFILGSADSLLNAGADITQTAIKYPVAMTGASLDAAATATRDGEEALSVLKKEGLFLTSGAGLNVLSYPIGFPNATISMAQDLTRTTVKGIADTTAAGVGLIDKEAGNKLQENIDTVDGAVIAANTADALVRGGLTMPAVLAPMALPLADEDTRGALVDSIKQHIDTEKMPSVDQMQTPKEVAPIVEKIQELGKEPTQSKLKGLLKTLSKSADDMNRKNIEMAPAPEYNPLSGGREGLKELVQKIETYRKIKNNTR